MISLQSHNQILYHLTQLTSAVSPKSTLLPVKVKRQNESFQKNRDEASHCDMPEVVKNNIEISIDKLNMYDATTRFRMKRTNAWVMLDQLSMNICRRHLNENIKWKVSYVSTSSFAKNKQSFPCAPLTEPILLSAMYLSSKQYRTMCMLCANNPFLYHVQIRNFKTERAMKKVNLEQNKSFVGKLMSWVYTQRKKNVGTTVLFNVKDLDYDKLKTLLNTKEMTPDEKYRIRYAFMEGFEAGIHRQIQSRFPWSKTYQHVLFTVSVILILWTAATPGSLLKYLIKPRGEINPEIMNVSFEDVKGIEEAKEELRDIVEYLKNPEKFSVLGGKLPKGVLLVGPPGTGKTLLARAVAGEASVPFFHASGSEFDEILVGQGARRVRDLFNAAKQKAPAVIFIDEIDSVGAKRTASVLHPYANQTINQLLAEMDGFVQNEGIIVLGATNRREDLDKALLRPGRFDVHIFVDKPDYVGRKEIINLYLSKVLSRNIDVEYLARCTSGYTGADIENMINQAALAAAKADASYVTMEHMEYAQDKVQLGPAGKVKNNSDESIRIAAYHEAGHTLVGYFTKDVLPLRKVTIIPRGPSLGHTQYVPSKDEGLETKSYLLGAMDTLMGGRAAEELVFGPDKVTTGALSDFSKATDIAEKMVKYYGMSDKVGFRIYGDKSKLGVESNGDPTYSPSTCELIDNEIKRLLQESYERAKVLLKTHAKIHKRLAESLLKYETLTADEVKAIIEGKKTQTETTSNPAIIVEPANQAI